MLEIQKDVVALVVNTEPGQYYALVPTYYARPGEGVEARFWRLSVAEGKFTVVVDGVLCYAYNVNNLEDTYEVRWQVDIYDTEQIEAIKERVAWHHPEVDEDEEDEVAYMHVAFVWSRGTAGYPSGSFMESLIEAMIRADSSNLSKLETVFPRQVAAYRKIKAEGLPKEMYN